MMVLPVLLLLASAVASAAPTDRLAGSKPNILVLFADDLGVGDLGVTGHPTTHTPNIDALANGGVRFTAWYSGFHICSPSRAAMLTGRLCVRSGTCGANWLGGVFSNKPVGGLPTSEITFATALKGVGYTTAAMGKWHLGTKDKYMPLGHGFEHYFGIPFSVDMGKSAWSPKGQFPPLPLVHGDTVLEQPADLDTLSVRYADFASGFITNATKAGTPFLLYLAFQHVHQPDYASPKFCGVSKRGLFGDVLSELDWLVGQVIDAVDATGERNNTAIFFSSDNGPWTILGLKGGSAGPFRDGKGSVWEGGVREPGFVNWQGHIEPRIESEPAATYDIFPTALSLAGVPLPSDREFDGKSLLPILTGTSKVSAHQCIFYWKGCTNSKTCGTPNESPLINKKNPGLWAVRCGSYKTHFVATNVSCVVHYMPPGYYQDEPLVYRIDRDPSEKFPLDPVLNKEERDAQITIARAAVESHIGSLKPVVNQIALGSDSAIVADGGGALCCNDGTTPARGMNCTCNPDNLDVFVCKARPETGWVASPESIAMARAESEAAMAYTPEAPQPAEEANAAADKGADAAGKPNVVMFFVDDSGYGDTQVYGAPSTLTPSINKMAAAGARFTQWYSAHAICTPSRAALMTGRLPIRYGLAATSTGGQGVFSCTAKTGLPEDEITIAAFLKKQGFKTMMVGKWHLGATKEYLPSSKGFDSYYGIPYSVDMGLAYNNRTEESWSEGGGYYGCTPLPLMANFTVLEQPVDLAHVHEKYTAQAVDFVTTSLKDKAAFFLYFAFGHVHTPQYAGVEQAGKSKRGIFGDSVAEVDASVGAVMDALGDSNTICLLSSDNGAPDAHQHLQPGQEIDAVTGSNHLFLGSKTQTWEGGLREPGLVWWPGKIAPQVRQEVASTLDVFATVADAVGAPMPSGKVYDSVSLLPLLTAKSATPPRNASFFYAGATLQAVRVGAYKAHLVTQQPFEPHAGPEHGFLAQSHSDHQPYGVQTPWLLFNVEIDPSELYPLKVPPEGHAGEGRHPAAAALKACQDAVAAHQKQLGAPPKGVLNDECDPKTGDDCRVCCDHAKKCDCTPKPPALAELLQQVAGASAGAGSSFGL